MKNRDKFREEIVKAFENDDIVNEKTCCFVRDNVLPKFRPKENEGRSRCGALSCVVCSKIFSFWLDEEYEETPKPEVDWSKVPVDTLVRVRDLDDEEWTLMYFKGVDEKDQKYRYMAWTDGATSKTACGYYEKWTYCELVEE
mgnify:CR=1 FL=1